MWVADIADECILEVDLLEQINCQVDLERSFHNLSGQVIPLHKPYLLSDRPIKFCYSASLHLVI